jgi:serum/glucocorticoid-regulated kinase 2
MYELIQHGELKFPTRQPISREAADLISQLLVRNPDQRLGASGTEAIKSHPFFSEVDWVAIYNKTVEPPFVPQLSGDLDTHNFEDQFTKEDIQDTVVNEN